MTPEDLNRKLDQLITQWEQETIEFKEANDNFSTSDIGKYVSALANEANLTESSSGWLIFGVENRARKVVGTNYREDPLRLQALKQQLADNTDPKFTLRAIHEVAQPNGRVILFEIPPAPLGIPIAWKGHYYSRNGESLSSLPLSKLDQIRGQTLQDDWTAQLVPQARLNDLDEWAVTQARQAYARKYANRFEEDEIAGWSDATFLDRAKLTIHGQLTRTTLLLLGKEESAHFLSPHPAQITWKLVGLEKAYQHFGPPFLLNTSRLYQQIRNIQLRILPKDELLAIEVSKYDQKIVLEALHNCLAHQDYRLSSRVVVTEHPDTLTFESDGDFYDGEPMQYLHGQRTPRRYRNPFLTQAMVELNMIDTMGYGIHEMNIGQARRYFPLPDFDLFDPKSVKLTLHGKVVDPAYSRLLIERSTLPLEDIFALDRVQKKLPIPDDIIQRLKKQKLIEGRKPNFHVSAQVASVSKQQADYIKNKGLNDDYYKTLIIDYLKQFQSASRDDITQLLDDKLGAILDEEQKTNKVSNLLTALRRAGTIANKASKRAPRWELAE